MTKILGISGKKQSGKDTAANYILGSVMKKLNYVREFKITPQGKLYVWWHNCTEGIVDYDSNRTRGSVAWNGNERARYWRRWNDALCEERGTFRFHRERSDRGVSRERHRDEGVHHSYNESLRGAPQGGRSLGDDGG